MKTPWTLLVMATLGCATQPATVPATIDPASQPLLTGEWNGTYESPFKERSGIITFSLEQDADSAICRGDVLMIPKATGQPVRPIAAHQNFTGQPMKAPRLLAIESIRVSGKRVSGRIEPYADPETMHPVRTSFDGTITGDTIRGTLLSLDEETGRRFVGTWVVTKKK